MKEDLYMSLHDKLPTDSPETMSEQFIISVPLEYVANGEKKLYFKDRNSIKLILSNDRENNNFYILGCEELDIFVYGEEKNSLKIKLLQNKLLAEIQEHIFNLYYIYKESKDDELTEKAIEKKYKYINMLQEKSLIK